MNLDKKNHQISGEVPGKSSTPPEEASGRRDDLPWPGYPTEAQNREYIVAWWDADLQATQWFGLSRLTALEAALLLCNLNPKHSEILTVMLRTEGEPKADDFKLMRRVFEDVALDGVPRSLRQWLEVANQRKLKHHSWVDQYLMALGEAAEERSRTDPPVATIPVTSTPTQPLQKQIAQRNRILQLIKEQGFDPLNLPERPKGGAGAKAAVKKIALTETTLFSASSFEKAWESLRGAGEVAGAN
ncbi:hypothetical protein QFZ83_002175 [Variovorax sp. W1I1]|uniref:hypothetical protein n=1 Tax=Variovorax sp. W1I1 TaxID=3042309 RepID=UPI0027804146|nr:hypothetical protein [Variovorax sp. W1I1]MDQ0608004.1 hypothetical protein [Variovorax sp. W1I1]